jgi:hypothetical protein
MQETTHINVCRRVSNVVQLLALFGSLLHAGSIQSFVQVTNAGGLGCIDSHFGASASCASGGIVTNGTDRGAGSASGDSLSFHLVARATAGGTGELVFSPFGFPQVSLASVVSEAMSTDVITVSGGPDQGFLRMVFSLDGMQTEDLSSLTGDATTFINLHNFENNAGPNGSQFLVDGSVGGLNRTATLDVPFSGGIVGLSLVAGVEADCFTAGIGVDSGVLVGCTSTVDLANTIHITGVGVVDMNGQLVSGAKLDSQSGTIYPVLTSTAAVPEPASFFLLLTAVVCWSLFRILSKRGSVRRACRRCDANSVLEAHS